MAGARFQSELRNMETLEVATEKQPVTCPDVNAGGLEMHLQERRLTSEKTDEIQKEVAHLRKENSSLAAATRQHRASLIGMFLLIICSCALLAAIMAVLVAVMMHKLSQLQAKVETQEKRVQEKSMSVQIRNFGEFVWRIDRWAARNQSARDGCCERIFSDAFFSHENGYKMCLSVWPNGHGAGMGTHVAGFFHLMRGPFDNSLSWPFERNVILSIINQHTDIDHVSRTISFNDFPNDTDFNQPTAFRSGGFGNYYLVKLAVLTSTAGLIENDTLSIRCVVR